MRKLRVKIKFIIKTYRKTTFHNGSFVVVALLGLRGGQKLTDSATVDTLCALCKGAGDKKCTRDDPYAGYIGAFRCMVEDKGVVAFVKHTTPQDAINKDRQKYGVLNDYQLICPEGMRKGM